MITEKIYKKEKDLERYNMLKFYNEGEGDISLHVYTESDIEINITTIVGTILIEKTVYNDITTLKIPYIKFYDTKANSKIGNLVYILEKLLTTSNSRNTEIIVLTNDLIDEFKSLGIPLQCNYEPGYKYIYTLQTNDFDNLYLRL